MDESKPPEKPEQITSETIARDVAEFLAKGGKIEKLKTKRKAPKHLKWITHHDMDYTPWEKL